MSTLVVILLLFCALVVLSWLITIPIALIALLIKVAPLLLVAAVIYGLVTGRIEITFHRDRKR